MRENLKRVRSELKYTQEDVAKKLGISRATYTNIELGNKKPSFDLAIKIKKVFNCKDDEIFLNI